ncbi:MAG: DUF5665 domain-containing protein [Candidatus Peribacteraceae bacterium]|jgi:hypothetical protein
MKHKTDNTAQERRLERAMTELQRTIAEMPKKFDFAFSYSPWKRLFLAFGKGVASTLGVVVAAAIIIPLLLSFLQHIDWIPLVGDFLTKVAQYMERSSLSR